MDTAQHPSDARPPGPPGHPIFGGLSRYHDDPIAFLEHNAATYGDVSAFRFFHLPVWQVNRPQDLLRDPHLKFEPTADIVDRAVLPGFHVATPHGFGRSVAATAAF